MLSSFSRALEKLLEWIVITLMVALTTIVIVAVLFRIFGNSLSWYDEVAAIFLSWVTYFGAGLAALKRRHIGFDSVLLSIPMPARMGAVILAEFVVIGFFVVLAQTGLEVLQVLEGEYLVSLTWVPIQLTQSIIPMGAILFVVCELLSLPDYWKTTAAGISLEHAEIEEEVETELKNAAALEHEKSLQDKAR
ncbi:MAG: TRAP transporter small permease subunit [Hyphomicrobiales bacterium]